MIELTSNQYVKQCITFSRNILINTLRYANLILDKSANNIVSIEKYDTDSVVLIFSDNISYFRHHISCMNHNIHTTIYVDREVLYNILRTLKPDDTITITENENVILVSYKYGHKNLPKIQNPAQNILPNVDGATIQFNGLDFIQKLKFVRHTVSHDDIRHQFKGVSINIQGSMQAIWSSDGYKLSLIEIQNSEGQSASAYIRCILPKKLIDGICMMEFDAALKMTISNTHALVTINDIEIVTPLIDGQPVDYAPIMKFMNEDPLISIRTEPSYLIQFIERATIGCDEQGWIKLEIDEHNAKLITNNIMTNTHGCESLDMDILDITGIGSFYINANTIIGFLKQIKHEVCIHYYANSKTITVQPTNIHQDLTMLYIVRTLSKR